MFYGHIECCLGPRVNWHSLIELTFINPLSNSSDFLFVPHCPIWSKYSSMKRVCRVKMITV